MVVYGILQTHTRLIDTVVTTMGAGVYMTHLFFEATKTALSFSAGSLRNLLPSFAPISFQWFSLYVSFSNICKATTVTHTKRIYRNLLRKETSFVGYFILVISF